MKTLTIHAAKDLRVEERPEPNPGAGEVLVQLEAGGICGSDLHYFNHGGFGTVRLREPMILGHEVAGRVKALGSGVTELAIGQRVAVSPSRPCGVCKFCEMGQQNHCLDMRFYGSAMPFPHIQGAFRELLVADAHQCVPTSLSAAEAAMAEPLSVVLHASKQAGDLSGKRVLVTGCGPIGLLCVLVAKAAGAIEVAATDIASFTLNKAKELGAHNVHNVAEAPDVFDAYSADKGHFDVLFECSGASTALSGAVSALRPGSRIVQLGLGGDMTLPLQAMTAKEISLIGSFRFHSEFPLAIETMERRVIDVTPLLSETYPIAEATSAFEMAGDRSRAIKVQIAF